MGVLELFGGDGVVFAHDFFPGEEGDDCNGDVEGYVEDDLAVEFGVPAEDNVEDDVYEAE